MKCAGIVCGVTVTTVTRVGGNCIGPGDGRQPPTASRAAKLALPARRAGRTVPAHWTARSDLPFLAIGIRRVRWNHGADQATSLLPPVFSFAELRTGVQVRGPRGQDGQYARRKGGRFSLWA